MMRPRLLCLILLVVAAAALVWAYWPTIAEMVERWSDDPQYSHGYLVPLFSAYLIWSNRKSVRESELSPSWWGIAFGFAGLGLWLLGTHFFFSWISQISILFCLAGLALVTGGWQLLRYSWQAILFLAFMVPLPYRLQNMLGGRLQQIATAASTYAIQTFGASAIREGNVILINDVKIEVVDACNGLGMLVTFVAISTAVAMILRRSEVWVRVVLILSAVPVALLANVARITATGLLQNASKGHLAHVVYHDVAGFLMMPLAIGILFLELYFLRRLVIERPNSKRETKGGRVKEFGAMAVATAPR